MKNYRYGFNGKEKDENGEFGSTTSYDYGFRIYNPAIGKFLSVDPLTKSFPWYTPYQFAGNKVIQAIDLDGLEEFLVIRWYDGSEYKGTVLVRLPNSKRIVKSHKTKQGTTKDIVDDETTDFAVINPPYSHEAQNIVAEDMTDLDGPKLNSYINKNNVLAKAKYLSSEEGDKLRKNFFIRKFIVQSRKKASQEIKKGAVKTPSEFNRPKTLAVHYDSDRSRTYESQVVSDVSEFLDKNPSYQIYIEGHTDSDGTEEYNEGLSEDRAMEVYQLLIDGGIKPKRISLVEGKGESSPKVKNDTNENKAKNRRVEIKFVIPNSDAANNDSDVK